MSVKFVKLFDFEDIGQVLVVQDQTDPIIKHTIHPEGFGLVEVSHTYKTFEACNTVFNSIDEEKAREVAEEILRQCKEFLSDD